MGRQGQFYFRCPDHVRKAAIEAAKEVDRPTAPVTANLGAYAGFVAWISADPATRIRWIEEAMGYEYRIAGEELRRSDEEAADQIADDVGLPREPGGGKGAGRGPRNRSGKAAG